MISQCTVGLSWLQCFYGLLVHAHWLCGDHLVAFLGYHLLCPMVSCSGDFISRTVLKHLDPVTMQSLATRVCHLDCFGLVGDPSNLIDHVWQYQVIASPGGPALSAGGSCACSA